MTDKPFEEEEEETDLWTVAHFNHIKEALYSKGTDMGDYVQFNVHMAPSGHIGGNYRSVEELKKSLLWAGGLPYIIQHPRSTDSSSMWVRDDKLVKGIVTDPEIEEMGRGMARINVKLNLYKVNPVTGRDQSALIAAHDDGTIKDVSPGLFMEPDPSQPQVIDGQTYEDYETRIRWTHLAGLPYGNAACEAPLCGITNDDAPPCPELCNDEHKKTGVLSMADPENPTPNPPPPAAPVPPTPDIRDLGNEALSRNSLYSGLVKENADLKAEKEEWGKQAEELDTLKVAEVKRGEEQRVENIKKLRELGEKVLGKEKVTEKYSDANIKDQTCEELKRDISTFEDILASQSDGAEGEPEKPKASRSLAPPAGPPKGPLDMSEPVEIGSQRDAIDVAYTPDSLRRIQEENLKKLG